VARTIVNNLPKTQRALLIAYTHGVNQGLLFLVSQPFEYLLLQQEAVQWSEVHSILTILAYTLTCSIMIASESNL
jgi:penicillin amidase